MTEAASVPDPAADGARPSAYGPDGPGLGVAEGFSTAIGMHLAEVSGRRVAGWIDVGPAHLQPGSIAHGGLLAAAVEEAASYGAAAAVRPEGRSVIGVANTTNFLRPATVGRILVEAVPLLQGRTQQLWEVTITRAGDGAVLTVGTLRLQNLPALP